MRAAGVIHAAIAVAMVVAWAGCERAGDHSSKPVLRLGYTPSEEAVADREKAMHALATYLERELAIKVELVRTASYGPAVDAMARGEIDAMSLGPFAYVLASRSGVAEVLVATATADGKPRSYRSALIAHRRADVGSLEELPGRAASLRLCYSDPASNSGHLVPQALLATLDLEGEERFASVEFTLSHSVSVFNVLFDRADVAGVSGTVLGRLKAKGSVPEGELVTLWESDALPSGPIAARTALPGDLKRALRDALVALPERDPDAAHAAMAQYQQPGLRYVAVEESLYDGLRALAREIPTPAIVEDR